MDVMYDGIESDASVFLNFIASLTKNWAAILFET